MPDLSDADRRRLRATRMLELANRAYCEGNYDFARLLTQLTEEDGHFRFDRSTVPAVGARHHCAAVNAKPRR